MLHARNVQEARAIEIAEHRTGQLCVRLESLTKAMKMAAAALVRLGKAIEKVPVEEDDGTQGTT